MTLADPTRRTSAYRPDFALPPGDLWVFGYGSLMWNPGFPHLGQWPATLYGYHRAFCIWSHYYRGTPEQPGVVLGLDAGGACRGRLFQVAEAERDAVVDYLFGREMISGVYRPRLCPVQHGRRGERVMALTFVANRQHPQYAGGASMEELADRILTATGTGGPCRDYLEATVRHLEQLGINDGPMHQMWEMVAARDRV